tara:strand:- start:423 stop:575 length:153 start_codon:yes stop_codon:yes gene_type:complete
LYKIFPGFNEYHKKDLLNLFNKIDIKYIDALLGNDSGMQVINKTMPFLGV